VSEIKKPAKPRKSDREKESEKGSESITIGSCGHRFDIFRREVAPGVVLEVWPYTVLIRLEKGRSVRFCDPSIRYSINDNEQMLDLEIVGISTGTFVFEVEKKAYGIQEQHFAALDKISGTGRNENIDMARGEWSPWKGKNDVFRLEFAGLFAKSAVPAFFTI
jgi:hypothetical protein